MQHRDIVAVDKTVVRTTVEPPPGRDVLEYVMSDETVDRMGDIIVASGWRLEHFKKNPIALLNHNKDFVVGQWHDVRVVGNQLRGRLELMPPVSERLREVQAAVQHGILRAVSVGFRPVPGQYELIEGSKSGGVRWKQAELAECSLVAVPANPNALEVAKSLGISRETQGLIFSGLAVRDQPSVSVMKRSGLADTHPIVGSKPMTMTMTLSEKIEAAQQKLVSLKDQLSEHVGKMDGEVIDEEAEAITEELTARIAGAEKQLTIFQNAEAVLAARSEPVARTPVQEVIPPSRSRPFALPKKEIKYGDYVLRALTAGLIAHATKRAVDDILREQYGDEETRIVAGALVTRAATVPATTTLTGWAAELVQTSVVDYISTLMPDTVFPRLVNYGGRYSFGRNGILVLPGRAATPTVAGAFVAEGAPIPVKQAAFTSVTMTPKKMGVISSFTRQILEHSTPEIQGLIQEAMQEDTSVVIDSTLLDNIAASAVRPAGLRAGVAGLTPTAGGGFNALVGDIKQLVNVLVTANSLRRPVWIMNPVQAISASMTQNNAGDFPFAADINVGRLQGFPLITSTTVPATMVILVDAADFVSVNGDIPRYDISDQATLHYEDTNPLQLTTGAQGSAVSATPTRSLWQTDTIAIRMMLDINWSLRRTGIIAWMTAVTW